MMHDLIPRNSEELLKIRLYKPFVVIKSLNRLALKLDENNAMILISNINWSRCFSF
jgi:hypothetical protein